MEVQEKNETAANESAATNPSDAPQPKRGILRQFYYDLLLFCGVQTQSNLSSTRKEPVKTRGIFLFRK